MANTHKSKYTGEQIDAGIANANLAIEQLTDKLDASELPAAINTALAEAHASGEFNGYTPIKGVDYYTDEDKTEMIELIIAALPVRKKFDGTVVIE